MRETSCCGGAGGHHHTRGGKRGRGILRLTGSLRSAEQSRDDEEDRAAAAAALSDVRLLLAENEVKEEPDRCNGQVVPYAKSTSVSEVEGQASSTEVRPIFDPDREPEQCR